MCEKFSQENRRFRKQQPKQRNEKKIFIQKSTVAIQTLESIHQIIQDIYKENKPNLTPDEIDYNISLLNIPEF